MPASTQAGSQCSRRRQPRRWPALPRPLRRREPRLRSLPLPYGTVWSWLQGWCSFSSTMSLSPVSTRWPNGKGRTARNCSAAAPSPCWTASPSEKRRCGPQRGLPPHTARTGAGAQRPPTGGPNRSRVVARNEVHRGDLGPPPGGRLWFTSEVEPVLDHRGDRPDADALFRDQPAESVAVGHREADASLTVAFSCARETPTNDV